MGWFGHGVTGWGYGLMMIGFMAFWGLVIYAVVLLMRRPGRLRGVEDSASTAGPAQTPQQLLAARFARGEISEGEYTDRLAVLIDHVRS